ncbi:MAG: toxin-antitoxin system YwqK family antitoxin [Opitutaceae bacterium]
MKKHALIATFITATLIRLNSAVDVPDEMILCEESVEVRRVSDVGRMVYEIKSGEPFTGTVVSFYSSGILQSSEDYKNGRREGLCKKFYPDGNKKLEVVYSNAPRSILATGWYPNGSLFFEASGTSFWKIEKKKILSIDGEEITDEFSFRASWPYRDRPKNWQVIAPVETPWGYCSDGSGLSAGEAIIIASFNHPSGIKNTRYCLQRNYPMAKVVEEGYIYDSLKVIKWYAISTLENEIKTIFFDTTYCHGIL